MKKLLVAALGLGIALGSVSFAAQDTSADTSAKKTKKHKRTKKTDTTSTSTSGNKM